MTTPPDLPGPDAFLRGDIDAVSSIRKTVETSVRAFRFGPSVESDLVQDALMRLLVNLGAGQFRGESSLRTYAARVARYTCLEHLRRRRDEQPLDPEAVPSVARWSHPEESFLWTEEHLRNLDIFSRLPADCRELLRWIFVEGLSYRDVGARLGVSEGAVKVRVFRCRLAFRSAAGLVSINGTRSKEQKEKP
ncbi:MAG: RNA polymerase sigma factor [Candidatus Polarisedimenticolia bacterium]